MQVLFSKPKPFFELFPSEIPPLKNYGLENCENFPDAKFPFVSDGKPIMCRLDFNKNITPYFDIEAEAGMDIHIKSNMRRNSIETFYKTNWTGVGEAKGHFETDDEWYTRIWQMAENTLYICARDNFMDTPDRERGLWIGDVADQASYLFYSMDQRFRELPAQSLQFIEQGIWHYYYNTGDIETLKYAYPYVHRYLSIWETQDNGLVVFRNGAWRWTDWGPQETIDYEAIQNALYYSALVETIDYEAIQNALYYSALVSARKMAKAIGDDTHIER